MRQSIIVIAAVLFLSTGILPSSSAIKGSLEYTIPIDYNNINETEFAKKAEYYYNKTSVNTTGQIDDSATHALNLYRALNRKNPSNIEYACRIGCLYGSIGKYRHAKGYFYQAIGVDKKRPEPYFYLGEIFYKQKRYRQALKMYEKASENGFSSNGQNTNRIIQIKKMLGEIK